MNLPFEHCIKLTFLMESFIFCAIKFYEIYTETTIQSCSSKMVL